MEINPQLPGAPDGQVVTSYTYTANAYPVASADHKM
jgi:hypothetical protein